MGQVKSVLPPHLLLHAAKVRQFPRRKASMKAAELGVSEINHLLHALMLWLYSTCLVETILIVEGSGLCKEPEFLQVLLNTIMYRLFYAKAA